MRIAWLWLCLLACEPALPPPVLPELVAPETPAELAAAPARVGALAWEVRADGLAIGRLELAVAATRDTVTSRFATTGLAASFARVHHTLTTWLAGATPAHSLDVLDVAGDHTELAARFDRSDVAVDGARARRIPDGATAHTLHTALAAVQAWARPGARPGFLYVVHAGAIYRLDLGSPRREGDAVRIDARLRALAIDLTLWLRASDRVPLRVAAHHDGTTITAALVAP